MKRGILLSLSLILTLSSLQILAQPASAAEARNWKAGNIIDDALFTDKSAMTVTEIQNWLNARLGSCDTNGTLPSELSGGIDYNGNGTITRAEYGRSKGNPAPFTCLNNYFEVPKTTPSPSIPASNYGGAARPAGSKSAAQLIYDASQAYRISPKVLLVKLGTESAGPLTSDTWPFKSQYTYAMGAHCPDSGPGGSANCDVNYSGFSMQIREAAKLLRWYLDSMTQSWWAYKKPRATNYILWNVQETNCGGSNVYIENSATAALYTYTPYQPNAAALNNLYGTGDGCSAYGNRNFWRVYNDWFGSSRLPQAIKGKSSGTVYMQSDGYKFSVPSMAVLQDYGISPKSIKTVPDSTVASIPTAVSPMDNSVGYLVKSPSDSDIDGGSVYLVSIGKRYKVRDLAQLDTFGFSTSDIKRIPLGIISTLSDKGQLPDFIATPTNNVFKAENGAKNIIFSYNTYSSLNPSGSVARLSHGAASIIAGGSPLVDSGVFVRKPSGAIAYYEPTSGNYHSVPNMNTYSCWGINKISSISKYYKVARTDYIENYTPTSNLECFTKDTSGTISLVDQGKRYNVPASYGVPQSLSTSHADVITLSSKLPNTLRDLSPVVKSSSSSTVWYVGSSARRPIPSMHNLALLGYSGSDIDTISPASLSSIPESKDKKLGTGKIVKSPDASTVWVIYEDKRYTIGSAQLLTSLGYRWRDLETYSKSFLDSSYPLDSSSVGRFIASPDKGTLYYFGPTTCSTFDSPALSDYGIDGTGIIAQNYSTDILGTTFDLSDCGTATKYVKSSDSTTLYKVVSGTKYAFSSWKSFTADNAQSDPSTIVDSRLLDSIPTGAPL